MFPDIKKLIAVLLRSVISFTYHQVTHVSFTYFVFYQKPSFFVKGFS